MPQQNNNTISASETYLYIKNIFNDIFAYKDYNIQIRFNELESIGEGETIQNQDDMLISIGCQNIIKKEYKDNNDVPDVSLYDFAELIAVAYHEKKHALQHLTFLYKDDETTLKLAIENVSQIGNRQFYQETYYTRVTELDAEYYAIKNAYHDLTEMFDEKTANELLLHYIQQHGQYFINMQQPDIPHVLQDFQQLLQTQLEEKPTFVYQNLAKGQNDLFYNNVLTNKEFWLDTGFLDITDGWEQQQYMINANAFFTNSTSLLPKGHIITKQNWFKNFDELPTRKRTLQEAREEALDIIERVISENTKQNVITKADIAIAAITEVVNNGTKCKHSKEVIDSIAEHLKVPINTLTYAQKEYLWEQDHQQEKDKNHPETLAVVVMENTRQASVTYIQNGTTLSSGLYDLKDIHISKDMTPNIQLHINGYKYEIELTDDYPEFSQRIIFDIVRDSVGKDVSFPDMNPFDGVMAIVTPSEKGDVTVEYVQADTVISAGIYSRDSFKIEKEITPFIKVKIEETNYNVTLTDEIPVFTSDVLTNIEQMAALNKLQVLEQELQEASPVGKKEIEQFAQKSQEVTKLGTKLAEIYPDNPNLQKYRDIHTSIDRQERND